MAFNPPNLSKYDPPPEDETDGFSGIMDIISSIAGLVGGKTNKSTGNITGKSDLVPVAQAVTRTMPKPQPVQSVQSVLPIIPATPAPSTVVPTPTPLVGGNKNILDFLNSRGLDCRGGT